MAAPSLTAENLDDIAARSAARNAAAGITGLLLHQGDRFYGVMEGPQARVFQRMEVIITDRRHAEVRILREEAIAGAPLRELELRGTAQSRSRGRRCAKSGGLRAGAVAPTSLTRHRQSQGD